MKAIETITGRVSVLNRDDVDTDQIIPKQFLKRVERTGFGDFLFYDWAKEPGWELARNPILVAGRNFGCGSSREHAPWALEDYGFQAIIAPSFADIFRSNCTKIGLLPVELSASDCAAIAEAGEAQVDLAGQVCGMDVGPSMAEDAREALGERATVLCQDLIELDLPEPVDVAFSNATFHWIHDHDALFASLRRALKPGGRLVAQCGGYGNI